MRVLLILLVLLSTVPHAAADAAVQSGRLVLHEPAGFRGEVRMTLSEAGIDLVPMSRSNAAYALSWDSASGIVQTTNWTQTPAVNFNEPVGRDPHRFESGAARLLAIDCARNCSVLLFTKDQGVLTVDAHFDGRLARARNETVFWSEIDEDVSGAFVQRYPNTSVVMGLGTPSAAQGNVTATGTQFLFAKNAVLRLDGAGDLDLRDETTSSPGILGDVATRTSSRFAFLELTEVAFAADLDRVMVVAERAELTLDGDLDLPGATGSLSVAGRTRQLDHARIEGTGQFELVLAGSEAPGDLLREASAQQMMTVRGWATEFRIAGAVVAVPSLGAATPPEAAIVAAALLVAVRVVLPLYTRITRDSVFTNANRRALWAAINDAPGMTVARLSRATGLSRIVVRYHISILMSHQLLTTGAEGRLTLYYPADHASDARDASLTIFLAEGSRRRIATAIVEAAGPSTQAGIARATGCSPRLVSYHLARLESLSLVDAEGEWRRRYVATKRLRNALQAASENQRPETE